MDALVCVAPGELVVEQRPEPVRGAGEVLVRPLRVGICGTDYHIYEGKHPFLQYPRVMGHELAVEVLDADAASGLRTGQVCAVNPYLSCGACVACSAVPSSAALAKTAIALKRPNTAIAPAAKSSTDRKSR